MRQSRELRCGRATLSLPLQEPAAFAVLRMGSPGVALNIWCVWTKAAVEVQSRQTDLCSWPGREASNSRPKSLPADLPYTTGCSSSSSTNDYGSNGNNLKLFYLISLAKCLSQPPKSSLAEPGVSARWGHRPAPCQVTQSIPVTDSTTRL